MLNDPHVFDLLPAYALEILDEEETRLVREHIAGCYLCRKELKEFQQVADQLALAAPDVTPPDSLRLRLMERIDGLERKESLRHSPALAPGASVRRAVRSTVQVSEAPGWRFPRRLLPIGLFASMALILLLAVSNILLWQRMNHLEVLRGPLGMRAIALQNTSVALQASGFVIMGADGENGVLVVDKLPPLEAAREYQVWLVKNSKYTSGGVFEVDEHGYRGMRLTAPDSLLSYSSVQVTIEPAGGSAGPTGEAVLKGSLFNR